MSVGGVNFQERVNQPQSISVNKSKPAAAKPLNNKEEGDSFTTGEKAAIATGATLVLAVAAERLHATGKFENFIGKNLNKATVRTRMMLSDVPKFTKSEAEYAKKVNDKSLEDLTTKIKTATEKEDNLAGKLAEDSDDKKLYDGVNDVANDLKEKTKALIDAKAAGKDDEIDAAKTALEKTKTTYNESLAKLKDKNSELGNATEERVSLETKQAKLQAQNEAFENQINPKTAADSAEQVADKNANDVTQTAVKTIEELNADAEVAGNKLKNAKQTVINAQKDVDTANAELAALGEKATEETKTAANKKVEDAEKVLAEAKEKATKAEEEFNEATTALSKSDQAKATELQNNVNEELKKLKPTTTGENVQPPAAADAQN